MVIVSIVSNAQMFDQITKQIQYHWIVGLECLINGNVDLFVSIVFQKNTPTGIHETRVHRSRVKQLFQIQIQQNFLEAIVVEVYNTGRHNTFQWAQNTGQAVFNILLTRFIIA